MMQPHSGVSSHCLGRHPLASRALLSCEDARALEDAMFRSGRARHCAGEADDSLAFSGFAGMFR